MLTRDFHITSSLKESHRLNHIQRLLSLHRQLKARQSKGLAQLYRKTKVQKVKSPSSKNMRSLQASSPRNRSPKRKYHDVDEEEKSPVWTSPHKSTSRIQPPREFLEYDTLRPRSPPRGYLPNDETLKHTEEKELVIALNDLLMMENDLEQQKINLSIKPDFNLIDLFRMFDVEAKGYITFEEFRYGLTLFKLYPSTDDIFLLFTRFDSLKQNILRYSEFCDIF